MHGIAAVAVLLALAGCGGGGSSGSGGLTVEPARTYRLGGFVPAARVRPGRPTTVSFTIVQPSGRPLTAYRRGAGPHNGVHLIVVKRDLSVIIHHHPPVGANGRITDRITFPSPGPYRIVIDAYPATGAQPNFQLFSRLTVTGAYKPAPVPPPASSQTVAGYRFTLRRRPRFAAIEPAFLHFTVTGPGGKPATFTPWFGALAHAIFFRVGSLDYFHTHVCAPGATGCTSVLGATKVTGSSTTPGKLDVGVLVPVPGTWRLFLQCRVDGHVVTAPFTLHVS